MPRPIWLPLLAPAVFAWGLQPAWCLDHVTVDRGGKTTKLSGEAVLHDRAGGMLLKTADGGLHTLPAEMIVSRSSDSEPLKMFNREQLAEHILAELPADFQVHHSTNYVICYNTTRTYAEWTSSLLERLQKGFIAFWKKRGCQVAAPKEPLSVLVFADQASYADYAREDLGSAVRNVIGYYSVTSNKMIMYDLTGMQALRAQETRGGSLKDITALLSLPIAEPQVATIIHEASHQVSFNCGLQTRLAPNPLWLSEGLAVFCETPDLNSSRSWSGFGNVNYARWDLFRENWAQGRTAPLSRMVADDEVFRDPKTAVDCYAQAWAWNYFLIKWRPKEYAAYLKLLAAKPLLSEYPPKQRLADFQKCFGSDLPALENDFYRRMDRVK
jgi:hypothetical protein